MIKVIFWSGVFLIPILTSASPALHWESGRLWADASESEIHGEAQALGWLESRDCQPQNLICDSFSCRADLTACLPKIFREQSGRVFAVPGPNCFATALRMTGQMRSFRAVDTPEFDAFRDLACHEVTEPEFGDLGVFEAPRSFGSIHAYVVLTKNTAFEKQGVDTVLGKTPLLVRSRDAIVSRVIAPPECRRYSQNPNECFNRHFFLRCRKPANPPGPWFAKHEAHVIEIENEMSRRLERESVSSQENAVLEAQLRDLRKDLEQNLESEVADAKWRSYLRTRHRSLEKQMEFFRLSL